LSIAAIRHLELTTQRGILSTIRNDEPDVPNDGIESDKRMGRVLNFQPRRAAPPRLVPHALPHRAVPENEGSPVSDMAKYEQSGDGDDFAHRMRMNAAAIVVLALLVAGGVWIAITMAEMQKNQNCVLQGRRNCAPIDMASPSPR
jgi:hypothetical protein